MHLARTFVCVALICSAVPVWAEKPTEARLTILMDVLGISDVVEVMRAEGFDYADDLNTDMLNGQAGALWAGQITSLYDAGRMSETVRGKLADGMDAEAVDAAISFFASDTGAQIIELEIAGRVAMADETIEDIARQTYFEVKGTSDPRFALIADFEAANDLWERNVSGALTANYRFYQGLVDGDGIEMTEDEIIEDVWDQEQEIRDDTESWLFGYLMMAYRPLPDEGLQAYIDFSNTEAGGALNSALFDGFNLMYEDISYGLGRAVAMHMVSEQL